MMQPYSKRSRAPVAPRRMDELENWRLGHHWAFADEAKPGSDPIYHYTDVRGALGILKSGRFWFTERAHLNDPGEVNHCIELVRQALESLKHQEGDALRKAFSEVYASEHKKSVYYIASFTDQQDDLGQWRSYADDGRGVVLGFSYAALKEFPSCSRATKQFHAWRGGYKVKYSNSDLKTKFPEIIQEAAKRCAQRNQPPIVAPLHPVPPEAVALELFRIAQFAGFMNKHQAYKPEQETRFLYWCDAGMTLDKHSHDGNPCIHCDVRERNGELVQYLDVPIPEWKKRGTLTHIRLGPSSAVGLEDQLRQLCEQLGIPEPVIEKSDIPYRSTRSS